MRIFLPLLAAAILLGGCLETKFSLGPRESAKVDKQFIGDWHFSWKDGEGSKSADLVVRNFNGKEYYVEWTDEGKTPVRMSAFVIDVKGASFVHLLELFEDGQLDEKNTIMRISMKDDKLVLRSLKEDFFEGISSDEQLQKRVSENIDNPAMYDGEGESGTRVASKHGGT